MPNATALSMNQSFSGIGQLRRMIPPYAMESIMTKKNLAIFLIGRFLRCRPQRFVNVFSGGNIKWKSSSVPLLLSHLFRIANFEPISRYFFLNDLVNSA